MSWERLRSSYDQVAERYEETFRDELADKQYDRDLLDRLGDTVEDPILEVGCGPGQIARTSEDEGDGRTYVEVGRPHANRLQFVNRT